jgi:hypothetical protein
VSHLLQNQVVQKALNAQLDEARGRIAFKALNERSYNGSK